MNRCTSPVEEPADDGGAGQGGNDMGNERQTMMRVTEGPGRKPEWLKKPLPKAAAIREVEGLLRQRHLHTVCESAKCPNKGECFERGTATFLIMGNACTRDCRFCSVPSAVSYTHLRAHE